MPSGSGPTPTSKPISDRKHSIDSNEISKNAAYTRSVSYDPIDYVQKARVTKTAPPKPAYNPLQFVQLKPSNLFVNAQEQVKKAEEVKKNKEVTKEEPEDWQCNLDNWKSSRRKRVEHIIDRVVEVKKLELVEHDRNRKKSATFSEMMEKRGARSKLAVYNDDDTNDLSDLGIGTSSASGKSSLSDDFDNHSVISDNQDTEKSFEMESITRSEKTEIIEENNNRDYTSSPGTGYDTSSSAAPTSSPDPSEYTYEGAIQEYKSRVSRAGQIFNGNFSKETSERKNGVNYYISPMKKHSFATSKFDDRYMEIIRNNNNNNNDSEKEETAVKLDLPKVDIHKRKELFEKASIESSTTSRSSAEIASTKSIKERLSSLEQNNITTEACKKSATDIAPIINSVTIKDRLVNLEKEVEVSVVENVTKTELPLTTISLKDRLSSLQSAVENSATVIIKDEDKLVEKLEEVEPEMEKSTSFIEQQAGTCGEEIEVNPEDSGFHTTDVSYTNSQADENQEEVLVDQQPNLIKVKENNCDNITTHQAEEAPETVQENICPSDNDDLENEQDISVSQIKSEVITSKLLNGNLSSSNASNGTLNTLVEEEEEIVNEQKLTSKIYSFNSNNTVEAKSFKEESNQNQIVEKSIFESTEIIQSNGKIDFSKINDPKKALLDFIHGNLFANEDIIESTK